MAADYQSSEQSQKKPAVTVSRIILVLILIAALAALGFDYLAKNNMNTAYGELDTVNAEAEEELKTVSRDTVKQTVGKEPSFAQKDGTTLIEHFDFPGVFYNHRLIVEYQVFGDNTETLRAFQRKSVFRFFGE